MSEKVVMAYSGGLDTSVAVRWLQEYRGLEVITLTADLGGHPELAGIRSKALATGAVAAEIGDERERFIREFCWPALRASALYQGRYPLATALGRPLIVRLLVEAARRHGAKWVAHGSTAKGNDQIRFDVGVRTLAPDLNIIAPLREGMDMTREEEIEYARRWGIAVPVTVASPYSVDENLWGRSIEAGPLEDADVAPADDVYQWTAASDQCPDGPGTVEIEFEQGVPVSLDRQGLSPVELVERLNQLGGRHGVGRIDMVEDRYVGIKSREIYEAPAAVILHQAHQALEDLVLDAETARFKELASREYARAVYQGRWYSAQREHLDAYVSSTQRWVCGSVRVRLHKGSATVVGRRSDYSLYQPDLATYSQGDQFNRAAAAGFIELSGLPLVTQHRIQGSHDSAPSKG